jgi:hypothetical protein
MSQTEKAAYYQALKEGGIAFEKHYRDYSTDELRQSYITLTGNTEPLTPAPEPPAPEKHPNPPSLPLPSAGDDLPPSDFYGLRRAEPKPPPAPPLNPSEMAGERLNSTPEGAVIRVDEGGRKWLQEEIRKPAYPKPRGRRVLTYMDSGTEEQSIKVGDYIETFEVAGSGPARLAEVKVTLPSYQVGIYIDPRFPFKVHVYNGQQGFDLFDIQDYYGGAELVPAEIKRIYVENVLCYEIRTVVRAIETEYRQLQLAGKVPHE